MRRNRPFTLLVSLVLVVLSLSSCDEEGTSPTEPSMSYYTFTAKWRDTSCSGYWYDYVEVNLYCESGCLTFGEIVSSRLSNQANATTTLRVSAGNWSYTILRPDNTLFTRGSVSMNSNRTLELWCN